MASIHGVVWPAVSAITPAGARALAEELERTQWLSASELAAQQQRQLAVIVAHARAHVPHYAGIDTFASVPVMSRAQIIAAGPALLSRAYPAPHGKPHEVLTSRTSGEPVRVRATGVIAAKHGAITLRDHQWHQRDLHAHLASIRYAPQATAPDGVRGRGWNATTALIAPDAPASALSITATTAEQRAWLERMDPTYLTIYPSALDVLLRQPLTLPSLREVRTVGERVDPALRVRVREQLNVPLTDLYSAQEVGYIALQCPTAEHYHVQAESLLVEILRDDDTPCSVGETGRVVVTDLHNFATPILRYDIGDYAEVGAPCACGRGLPVLSRIVGRRRHMCTYPDGSTRWPVFTIAAREAARYAELQLVQLSPTQLQARVVPLADEPVDHAALITALQLSLRYPFSIEIEIVPKLSRTPGGKLEEFVSHVF